MLAFELETSLDEIHQELTDPNMSIETIDRHISKWRKFLQQAPFSPNNHEPANTPPESNIHEFVQSYVCEIDAMTPMNSSDSFLNENLYLDTTKLEDDVMDFEDIGDLGIESVNILSLHFT